MSNIGQPVATSANSLSARVSSDVSADNERQHVVQPGEKKESDGESGQTH